MRLALIGKGPSESPWTNANIGAVHPTIQNWETTGNGKKAFADKDIEFLFSFPGCFFLAREYSVFAAFLQSSWRQLSHPCHSFWFQSGWNYQGRYLVFLFEPNLHQTHPQKSPFWVIITSQDVERETFKRQESLKQNGIALFVKRWLLNLSTSQCCNIQSIGKGKLCIPIQMNFW